MPLPSLICAILETSINQLLSLDDSANERAKPLAGKAIKLNIKELKQPLYFFFANKHIEIFSEYEGPLEVEVSLTLSLLPQLQKSAKITELIKSEQLVIDGDIKLLQQFAELLTNLDIDWPELLSTFTGDVLAHRISSTTSVVISSMKSRSQRTKEQLGQYLNQEIKLLVGQLEFVHFSDQISDLTTQLSQLEQRIQSLKVTR